MQEVAIDMDKFTLKEDNTFAKENNCKNYLQLKESKTRSTPTSPNCYRTQNLQNAKAKGRESPVIRLALFPRLEKCLSEPEVWDKGAADEGEDTSCPGSKSEGHLSDMSGTEEADGELDTQAEKVRACCFRNNYLLDLDPIVSFLPLSKKFYITLCRLGNVM